jgi:hypothetical protein
MSEPPCRTWPVYVLAVASATDWLTAIGTVGAVVVALATPAVTWALRRRRRPVLRIELSGSEPNLRPVLAASSDAIVAFWLRFTVTNSGRSTGQAVRAQPWRYWVRQASEADQEMPWVECALAPQPLSWISRPYHIDPARREAVAIPAGSKAIPAGSNDLATVALFTVPDAIMTLKFLDADYVPSSLTLTMPRPRRQTRISSSTDSR